MALQPTSYWRERYTQVYLKCCRSNLSVCPAILWGLFFGGWGKEEVTNYGRKKRRAPERKLQFEEFFNTLLYRSCDQKKKPFQELKNV